MFILHSPAALWAGGNWQAGKMFGGLAPFPRVTVPEKRKPWKPNTCPAAVFSPVPEVKITSTVKQGAGALHPAGLKVNSYDSFPRMLLLVTPRDHVVWAPFTGRQQLYPGSYRLALIQL